MAKYERNKAEPWYSYAGLHFEDWHQNDAKLCSGSFLAPPCGLGPECFKTVFRELPGSTLLAGPRMLQNRVLGSSWLYFVGWPQNVVRIFKNCVLVASWLHFADWQQNAAKLRYGRFLAPRCGLAPEFIKTALWDIPGITLRAGTRILQNHVMGASWLHFAGWPQNAAKLSAGNFLARLWGMAPEFIETVFWELPGAPLCGVAAE